MNNKDFYVRTLTNNVCRLQYKNPTTGYDDVLQVTLMPSVLATAPHKPAKYPNTQYSFPVYNMDTKKWIELVVSSIQGCAIAPLSSAKNTRTTQSQYAGLQPAQSVTSSVNTKLRDSYINYLQHNICEIVFRKSDGTIRTMKATLKTSVMVFLKLTPTGSGSVRHEKDLDVIRVIDIEKNDWRSFRLSRLISLTIDTRGLIHNYPPNDPTTLPPGVAWYNPTTNMYEKWNGSNWVLDKDLDMNTLNDMINYFQSTPTGTSHTELDVKHLFRRKWPDFIGVVNSIYPVNAAYTYNYIIAANLINLKLSVRYVTKIVDDGSSANNWNITAIKDQLRKSICEIVFKKSDNTMRTMIATTLSSVIASYDIHPSGTGKPSTDPDLIRVVDVDKKDWRSFRFSKMVSFKPLNTTVTASQPQPAPTVVVRNTKLHRS